MSLIELFKKLPSEKSFSVHPRPYVNDTVRLKDVYISIQRLKVLKELGFNWFSFPAEMVICDLLSDSGTTAKLDIQEAALHLGDESYGSNRGYIVLMEELRKVFGASFFNDSGSDKQNAFLFHQCRSAENALFTQIGKLDSGLVIPSNGHFDTTRGNIKINNMEALDLFSPALMDSRSSSLFKGDMDVDRLDDFLKKNHEKVPVVFLTITNNTGGGQPVSLQNIRDVSELSHKYGIPFFLDACRCDQNAWFIKKYEKQYEHSSIPNIIKEIFSYADGFTISFKKMIANMGGGLFIKNNGLFMEKYPDILDAILDHQLLKEGHPTYGGMSGRDIMALVPILELIQTKHYERFLTHRITQVLNFSEWMREVGVVTLAGGHAVYLDMDDFFKDTKMKREYFGGVSFVVSLLAKYGHRGCELGCFAFGEYDKEKNKDILPDFNFVRFAVPALRYEEQDLRAVVEAVRALYENRHEIPGVKVVHGRDAPARHFKARFELFDI